MQNLLSAGAITQILENQKPANPVLQIIGYKPMTPDQMAFGQMTEELRYRLMIGDGIKAHQYCVITNQDIVDDIKNGRLEKWSIIRVTSYQTVDYGDGPPENKRRLIYILNLEVVKRGSEVGCKLSCQPGTINPQPISGDNNQQQTPNTDSHFNNRPIQQQQTFERQPEPTQPQPYPMGGQFGSMRQPDSFNNRSMKGSHDHQTIGIGELTPYIGKWVVKGRVTSKSQIREYNNAKGGGKLFNFTMADKTGEIKITAFNTDCERVFPYVEINKVYVLGRASVKSADKRYTTADFEITLNNDSLLEEIVGSNETSDIPFGKFNFVSIGSLSSAPAPPSNPVDLIGVIHQIEDVTTVISKTKNKELKKRNVVIVDTNRFSISVTIWGEQADTFSGVVGDVFVTKSARVGTYGGKSASAGDCIFVNPDIPEVRKLSNWYKNLLEHNFVALTSSQGATGGADQWKLLDNMLNLEQAKINASSGQQSSMYAKCKAILMSVGKNPVYKCCPTEGCGKKLVDTQNGELRCEKCQQTYNNYKFRYKVDIEIEDASSSAWVTLWDEKAEQIFNLKPDELEKFMRMDNKEAYERILSKPTFQSYIFTLRSRVDSYNGEDRVKLQCVNLAPLDPLLYSKRLNDEIKAMTSAEV